MEGGAAVNSFVSSCEAGTEAPTIDTGRFAGWLRLNSLHSSLTTTHRTQLPLLHERARRHLTCLLGLSAILRVRQTADTPFPYALAERAQTQRSLASDCARLHLLP